MEVTKTPLGIQRTKSPFLEDQGKFYEGVELKLQFERFKLSVWLRKKHEQGRLQRLEVICYSDSRQKITDHQ